MIASGLEFSWQDYTQSCVCVCVCAWLNPYISYWFYKHKETQRCTKQHPQTRLTESSGGLCILTHSTDGPFTCRNLWKRFVKPSKSFLETWKTKELSLNLYSSIDFSSYSLIQIMWKKNVVIASQSGPIICQLSLTEGSRKNFQKKTKTALLSQKSVNHFSFLKLWYIIKIFCHHWSSWEIWLWSFPYIPLGLSTKFLITELVIEEMKLASLIYCDKGGISRRKSLKCGLCVWLCVIRGWTCAVCLLSDEWNSGIYEAKCDAAE